MNKKYFTLLAGMVVVLVVLLGLIGCGGEGDGDGTGADDSGVFMLFKEDFEDTSPEFVVTESSGWGVSKTHDAWATFNGSQHLDNNVTGEDQATTQDQEIAHVIMRDWVEVPTHDTISLSYWYKTDLTQGDYIYVDLYSRPADQEDDTQKEKIDRIKTYTSRDNTDDFHVWETINLAAYQGKKIRVAFTQNITEHGPGRVFVVDDVRISEMPKKDTDNDGIPNPYDPTPNGELLPPVDAVGTETNYGIVALEWASLASEPLIVGYRIYRHKDGETDEYLLNREKLISPHITSYTDTAFLDGGDYIYRVVGVSKEGHEGKQGGPVSVPVQGRMDFPFEESFDSVSPQVTIVDDSGWAIAEDHNQWTSRSYPKHLDSNPTEKKEKKVKLSQHEIRAAMTQSVHIPKDVENPMLSYWYKMKFRTAGDRIYIDIHYLKETEEGIEKEMIDPIVRDFKQKDNTDEYVWESIPLDKYKGTEMWLVFRQRFGKENLGSVFNLDDLRISEPSDNDTNNNGVPDEYEEPMNSDMLQFVTDLTAAADDVGRAHLSWSPPREVSSPVLAGYSVYRRKEGSSQIPIKINTGLIPADATTYIDTTIESSGTYYYHIVAVSTEGVEGYPSAEASAKITIVAPQVRVHPSDITVMEGEPASFAITAIGTNIQYQWQRNEEDIPGATESNYTIPVTTLEDNNAVYRCVVSNVAGSVASNGATLTVKMVPPVIETHPSDITVMEREPATFSVTAKGSYMNYQWQKDGADISGATSPTYAMPTAALSDSGTVYRCVVSNEAGTVFSNGATLTVKMVAPVITIHPADVTVTEWEPATFSVTVLGSYVSYQWQKAEVDIPGATESSYTIPVTELTDDKTVYRCVVRNAAGTVVSNSATLTVKLAPPVIEAHPSDLTVVEGDPATFTVAAKGSYVSYQWQKGETDIPDATESSYAIATTELSDNGTVYRCVVSNAAGTSVSNSAALTVQMAPPVIEVHPSDVTVTEGEAVTFTVTAKGSSINYQWQKNEADIPDATESSYTIPVTELTDNGTIYRCVVSNAAGTVASNGATLTVKLAPPVIEAHPSDITVIEGEPATLSVTAKGSNISYQWQKGETDIPGATEPSYAISETVVSDCGTYRCVVSNEAGTVVSTDATLSITMNAPENTTPVTNASAVWEEGHARLTWDVVDGMRYRIYRGSSQADMSIVAEVANPPFVDDTAKYYNTYYYKFATVKDRTHPCTNEVLYGEGPLSGAVTLQALPVPKIAIAGAELTPEGGYTMTVGKTPPYPVEGTYENMSGTVSITATSVSGTAIGSGSGGTFSIQLSGPGKWQITIKEQAGWMSASTELALAVDDQPPALTIDGPAERTTEEYMIVLTGTATDTDSNIHSVTLISDRYPDQTFGATADAMGAFSGEVPLKSDENHLTVIARDNVGNEAQKSVKVTVRLPTLPNITIMTPVNGLTVFEDTITVAGEVRSSLPPEQIRLVLGDQVDFPTGTNGEYTFSFSNVRLVEGPNTIYVTAETLHGNVTAQTTVTYQVGVSEEEVVPPTIEVQSEGPEIFVSEDSITVQGIANSDVGIQSITVNGQPVDMVGEGTNISFESILHFSDLSGEEVDIVVVVTDVNGNTSTATYTAKYDATPPAIALTSPGLSPAPAVNAVTETPYSITGTVTDKNLAGISINDQTIGVVPTATENTYSFDARIDLVRGEERALTIEAWDFAGNRTGYEIIVRLDTIFDIEIISPTEGAELIADTDPLNVEVIVRVAGMAEEDIAKAYIDTTNITTLTRSGDTARGSAAIAATDGTHDLAVEVTNAAGDVLARRTTHFSITNTASIALALERQEPANNERGVEPNQFIAFYFNKPIDPQLLQVQVLETAHGLVYASAEDGADILQMSDIQLIEVHRDRETVPGGISHFPGNTMAAFYPDRDFAYGGTVYVTILYNGEELTRSNFRIRPLPTFIQGFVADQFMEPIPEIEVALAELGRVAVTDSNGSYAFGFGDAADNTIPPGRYRAVINQGLKNRAFGTVECWMNVDEGRLNSAKMIRLPILNPNEPFRRIMSGQVQALLAAGELTMNLSNTELTFPNGRDQGDVHVQFMQVEQIAYPILPAAIPQWAFGMQPAGVEVSGGVGLTFSMPPMHGSHDYVEDLGPRVVLVGLDPGALHIVPVGVGRIDKENMQVVSEGEVTLKRLDYLGYAVVHSDVQPVLERYANGEITLSQMIGELMAAR